MTTPDWRALYPFDSTWHQLPAGRMHYVDQGPHDHAPSDSDNHDPHDSDRRGAAANVTPPTLLFVHGNPTWSFHWRDLIGQFSGAYRTIAPDHLGCGLSEKPAQGFRLADHIDHLVALVDDLELDRITLVAQDWGGAIGLGTLLQRPERFERIVLFNTGAFPPWYIPWRIAACRWPVVGRLAVQGANAFSRAALRMTLSRRGQLDPAVEEGYLAPYDTWDNRQQIYEFVADIPLDERHPTWSTLAEIEQGLETLAHLPILLVWGMQDWCFRPDCLQKFLEYWPQAEVQRLADVGHWVVEDAPNEARQLVGDFLDRTSRESSP